MVVWAFLGEHIIDVLFSLVSAGLLFLCKKVWKDKETYKKIVQQNNNEMIAKIVQDKIEESIKPMTTDIAQIRREITDMKKEIEKVAKKEAVDVSYFLDSEKTRIIKWCKDYLAKGYMTNDEWQALNHLYNNYHALGGNGEAEQSFEKAKDLPVREN